MIKCDAYTNNPKYILRVVCFLVHLIVATIVTVFVFKCPMQQFNEPMYFTQAFDFNSYAARSPFYDRGFTCNSTMSCFRNGLPWDDGYAIANMYWNPYALLFVFEWITVSMALYYLRVDMHLESNGHDAMNLAIWVMALAVNVAAATTYFVYFLNSQQSNGLEFVLVYAAFGLSTLVLMFYDTLLNHWLKTFADPLTNHVTAQINDRIWNIPMNMLGGSARNKNRIGSKKRGPKYTKLISTLPPTYGASPATLFGWKGGLGDPFDGVDQDEDEDFDPEADREALVNMAKANPLTLSLNDEVRQRMHVALRYLEYSCTAPFLYLAILCAVVVGAPYWAYMLGYLCILTCCLYGVPLQIMHIQEVTIRAFIEHVDPGETPAVLVPDSIITPFSTRKHGGGYVPVPTAPQYGGYHSSDAATAAARDAEAEAARQAEEEAIAAEEAEAQAAKEAEDEAMAAREAENQHQAEAAQENENEAAAAAQQAAEAEAEAARDNEDARAAAAEEAAEAEAEAAEEQGAAAAEAAQEQANAAEQGAEAAEAAAEEEASARAQAAEQAAEAAEAAAEEEANAQAQAAEAASAGAEEEASAQAQAAEQAAEAAEAAEHEQAEAREHEAVDVAQAEEEAEEEEAEAVRKEKQAEAEAQEEIQNQEAAAFEEIAKAKEEEQEQKANILPTVSMRAMRKSSINARAAVRMQAQLGKKAPQVVKKSSSNGSGILPGFESVPNFAAASAVMTTTMMAQQPAVLVPVREMHATPAHKMNQKLKPVIHASIIGKKPAPAAAAANNTSTTKPVIHTSIIRPGMKTVPPTTPSTPLASVYQRKNNHKNNSSGMHIIGVDFDEGKLTYLATYNNKVLNEDTNTWWNFFLCWFFMGKWRMNWVTKMYYMQVSWTCLLTAMCIVLYFSRTLLVSNILPTYVSVALWTMLIFYMMFGVVASLFYYWLDSQGWREFDTALDVLSLVVKVTIVLSLTGGYINMPGQQCF